MLEMNSEITIAKSSRFVAEKLYWNFENALDA